VLAFLSLVRHATFLSKQMGLLPRSSRQCPAAVVALAILVICSAHTRSLPLLDGCKSKDWSTCRMSLINSIFNDTTLPARSTPDFIVQMPDYAMHGRTPSWKNLRKKSVSGVRATVVPHSCPGFPGPGDGVGDVSHNAWSNNMTSPLLLCL
jgi:hypothetical protein